jgi:isopentenyl phosphate kinase
MEFYTMKHKVALIKLGGSVITFKDKPLSPNLKAINNISRVLASLETPLIIVHGGGSFGHYWSVKYDMHSKPSNYNLHGISIVHGSMIELNQIVVGSMIKKGMKPYGIMPSIITSGIKPIPKKIEKLKAMAEGGITPVTFGDIIHVDKMKYSIISGDTLMTILAKILRPSKVIFALNVDGLYKDLDSKEIISEISNVNKEVNFTNKSLIRDVTGGMRRKVEEAFKISAIGMDVVMVNGLKPDRIISVMYGAAFEGTIIKRRNRGKQK